MAWLTPICISLGTTLRRQVASLAFAERRSLSAQVAYLADLALDAPQPPGLEDDRLLHGNPCAPTEACRAIVYAEPEWLARVDARAKRMGETRSEAVRVLVEYGLAVDRHRRGRGDEGRDDPSAGAGQ